MFGNIIGVSLRSYEPYTNLIIRRNAGHSKWANIKHTKSLKDAQKSSQFTKFGRLIRVAIQEGGSPDPTKNLKLEHVIEQAKRFSMPVATIQSIIKSTQTDKTQCKSYVLDIKGPGSCIIMCEVFTDNLHRLKQLLATVLKKHSSKYLDGSGKHCFEQKGIIETNVLEKTEDIMETATAHAIESGAEDVNLLDDDTLQFVCSCSSFNSVLRELEKLKYKITSASIEFIPNKLQQLNETELEICSNLYDKLENNPEIVKVYDNIA